MAIITKTLEHWRLEIGDFRLEIGDLRLEISDLRFEILKYSRIHALAALNLRFHALPQ